MNYPIKEIESFWGSQLIEMTPEEYEETLKRTRAKIEKFLQSTSR